MSAMIPPVTGGWVIIMLIVALFTGAFIGLILMALLAEAKMLDECESCRYRKFYSRVMAEGKCPDRSRLWASDLATGPTAEKETL